MRERECESVWNDYQELLEQTYNGGGGGGSRAEWGDTSRNEKWEEKISELTNSSRAAQQQAEEYYRAVVGLEEEKRQLVGQISKLEGSLVEIEQAVTKREEETRGTLREK